MTCRRLNMKSSISSGSRVSRKLVAIQITEFQESKFISASDPTISSEVGQKIQDEQLREKFIYKSQILEIDQESMRFIAVDTDHAEAVVETNCRRI